MAMPTPGEIEVTDELRNRIRRRGPITFAEFMAVALYWPHGGYYATRNAFGPEGDFHTAPLVHPVFGALIARQLCQMWRAMGSPRPFWVVEPGAGSGRLAADVTAHANALDGGFASALRYVALDVHQGFAGREADWVLADGLPFAGLGGVLLANELLDALPVHRVAMEGGRLREVYVDVLDVPAPSSAGRLLGRPVPAFREVLGEPSTPALGRRLEALGIRLPDGYRTEVCLGIGPWLAEAARALDFGYALLIDYGHAANDYYAPQRGRGTLRCYYRHTLGADPYVYVGKQDIGAHVEFTSVMRDAEAAGFAVAGFTDQAAFLHTLGLPHYRAAIERRSDVPAAVRAANVRALDVLASPDGMGGFKVLALRKGVPETPLAGFGGGPPGHAIAEAPLATPAHMPLGPAAPRASALPPWEDLLR